MTVGGQFIPYTQIGEMIKQQWKKIGIDADVKETERGLAFTKTANAEHHIMFWTVGGSENLYLFPRHVLPVDPAECHLGMPFARWYASNGAQGKKPTNPEMLRAFDLLPLGGRQEGGRADQDRPGDLEDHRARSAGSSARWGCRRPSWGCGSSRTTWATSPCARPTRSTPARPTPRTRPPSSSRRNAAPRTASGRPTRVGRPRRLP